MKLSTLLFFLAYAFSLESAFSMENRTNTAPNLRQDRPNPAPTPQPSSVQYPLLLLAPPRGYYFSPPPVQAPNPVLSYVDWARSSYPQNYQIGQQQPQGGALNQRPAQPQTRHPQVLQERQESRNQPQKKKRKIETKPTQSRQTGISNENSPPKLLDLDDSEVNAALVNDDLAFIKSNINRISPSTCRSLGKRLINLAIRVGADKVVRYLFEEAVGDHKASVEADDSRESLLYDALATAISPGTDLIGARAKKLVWYLLENKVCLQKSEIAWLFEYKATLEKIFSREENQRLHEKVIEKIKEVLNEAITRSDIELFEELFPFIQSVETIFEYFIIAARKGNIKLLAFFYQEILDLEPEQRDLYLSQAYTEALEQGMQDAASWIQERQLNFELPSIHDLAAGSVPLHYLS